MITLSHKRAGITKQPTPVTAPLSFADAFVHPGAQHCTQRLPTFVVLEGTVLLAETSYPLQVVMACYASEW